MPSRQPDAKIGRSSSLALNGPASLGPDISAFSFVEESPKDPTRFHAIPRSSDMRTATCCILFVGLASIAAAGPLARKLEKKSISESAAVAAQVGQRLDASQISDEAIMEASPGAKVDRAKKQASTTFCVEIRHNKPTQVDCDEIHRPHVPLPPPPPPIHHLPEPLPEIHVHPPPPPPPIVIPQQPPPPPPPINIQVPCEPEMAAYVIQPPSEVVYAPTGNCAPQLPTVIHSGGGGSGVQVIHLPSSIQTGGHGTGGHPPHGGLTIHGQANLPVHAHATLPVHAHETAPVHTLPIQTQQPVQVHAHAIQTQQHPVQVHTHAHGPVQTNLYQQLSPGIECSCQSAQPGYVIQRSQGATSATNEALALQFLQDIQRNSNNSQQNLSAGSSVILQPPSTNARQLAPGGSNSPTVSVSLPTVSAGSSLQMGGKSILPSYQARFVAPTISTMPQQVQLQSPVSLQSQVSLQSPISLQPQVSLQSPVALQSQVSVQPPVSLQPPASLQSPMSLQSQFSLQPPAGRGFQLRPLLNAGITRSNVEEGLQTNLRLSRGPGDAEPKEQPSKDVAPNEGKKPSPSDIINKLKKKNNGGVAELKLSDDKSEPKNARIARFLVADKEPEINNLVEN